MPEEGFTPIQVGKVLGRPKADRDRESAPKTDAAKVENVHIGNAKVGLRADEIQGGLTIRR